MFTESKVFNGLKEFVGICRFEGVYGFYGFKRLEGLYGSYKGFNHFTDLKDFEAFKDITE